jgi:hypothetical protein
MNSCDVIADPNRWQAIAVTRVGGGFTIERFMTPHWGRVAGFALMSGSQLRPVPGPPMDSDPRYKEETEEVLAYSANLTDRQKVLAEYFADGPSSEFPPGHWALFAQFVSRRDGHTLDEDVKMFFALGNAMLDASIACWEAKRYYDYVRPITAIHLLYKGQTIRGWGGRGRGTVTMAGEDWKPHQIPGVVTPPFPEFFSGHSSFSAAAAEILASFTGSDNFGYSVMIPAYSSAAEPGFVPGENMMLYWPTFSAAAEDAGMSRRYGGIHFRSADLAGREVGRQVGALVWAKAKTYFNGTAR